MEFLSFVMRWWLWPSRNCRRLFRTFHDALPACFVGFWHVWARFRVFASFRPALACFIVLRHVYFFGLCNFVMFRHVLFSGMFNHVLAWFACFLLLLHIFTCCSMHISGQVLVSFFVVVASVDVRQAGLDCSWAALTWNQRQAFARVISS